MQRFRWAGADLTFKKLGGCAHPTGKLQHRQSPSRSRYPTYPKSRGKTTYWYCVHTKARNVSPMPPAMFAKPFTTSERENINVEATGSPHPNTGIR
mmetsp:Transcript_19156/g.36074  ORF Transcript_19156/g.36074 Transcript_19156/m.36074 type:complete len:96 (-) Transcript_19156:37-324(-)